MFLHDWNVTSSSKFMHYEKKKFKIIVYCNYDEFVITVYENGNKIDRFYNDLNTAVHWCEGRL